jgi:hypothetical protein
MAYVRERKTKRRHPYYTVYWRAPGHGSKQESIETQSSAS